MNGPRTAREALMAELLGDVDALLKRVEALPGQVDEAEAKVAGTIQALDSAGDRYRVAVTSFTDQAKRELNEHLDRATGRASELASKTVEEQRAAMQEAARLAFRSEASDRAQDLASALANAAQEFKRSSWTRLLEHGVTAALASGMTAGLLMLLQRGS